MAKTLESILAEKGTLAHYGVPGMRWGKTAGRAVTGTAVKAINAYDSKNSEDHKATQTIKKSPARKLSDAELKSAIKRMDLEKRYKDLNPKGLSKGQKAITAALALGATANAVFAFANSQAGKAIIQGLKNS